MIFDDIQSISQKAALNNANSAFWMDIPDLALSVRPLENWLAEYVILCFCSTNAGIKFNLTGPPAPVIAGWIITGNGSGPQIISSSASILSGSYPASGPWVTVANTYLPVRFHVAIRNGGDFGQLKLQFAPQANGQSVQINWGSMIAHKDG